VAASLVPACSYAECAKELADGRVDAVSTDDLILAGLATGSGTVVVNASLTDERYGIGLRKRDVEGCRAVNGILCGTHQNGAAETLLDQWFTAPGFDAASAVPHLRAAAEALDTVLRPRAPRPRRPEAPTPRRPDAPVS
jgi:glutamate transport system substrate-binding protein